MIRDFLLGASYIFKGWRDFYSDRKLWKFAVIPLGIMLIFYLLVMGGLYALAGVAAEKLTALIGVLPAWLGTLLNGGLMIFSILFFIFFLAASIGTFYELFGGLFFDSLTQYYENRRFGIAPRKATAVECAKFAVSSLFWGMRVSVIFCLLFIASFFFPVAGEIVLIAVIGYCSGVSYMICSAQNNVVPLSQLRRVCAQRRALVMGFGCTAYLLLLFPCTAIFLLPVLVIGGSELFNEQLKKRIS